MDTELMLDVSQAHEFKLACRRAGYTNADIKRMCDGDLLGRLLPAVRGTVDIVITTHTIDCDADPFVPDGWKVEEHQKGGQLQWDAEKVSLYLCDEQRGGSIEGNQLRKKLKGESVLNANVLDYLLANPQLIPDDWKGRYIFFWGTIYRHSLGRPCVRYLHCFGWPWSWNYRWLDREFNDHYPAALLRK